MKVSMNLYALVLLLPFLLITYSTAFVVPGFSQVNNGVSSVQLNVSKQGKGCEFEFQELKAQATEMINQSVSSSDLNPLKMNELTNYVKAVCDSRVSPIALREIGTPEVKEKYLFGKWRLAFCTENAAMSVMPREARIVVEIVDELKMNYVLEFTKKVQGLSRINAESTYTIDTSPINPGLLTFTYEKVSGGLFGMTVPLGLFGLFKGRGNFIESLYFDGDVWIERGYSESGDFFYNVYIKEKL